MKLLTPEWVTPDFDESISFELRGMNGLEYLEYSSHSMESGKGNKITFTEEQARVSLRAVSDWKGFEDNTGAVPFSQAALGGVDLQTMAWLLNEIVSRSVVGADAEKN